MFPTGEMPQDKVDNGSARARSDHAVARAAFKEAVTRRPGNGVALTRRNREGRGQVEINGLGKEPGTDAERHLFGGVTEREA